ncbi:uncharacterized protein LOC115879866 [Sitophilus oryzae]|uniref:Uncharacterized protein LOC115879866 n=1 Tax=Sitophilus oryzae TaxID=7048 RepID=A0A6J2XNW2_SITOR|nr:uncharacterized protein LOC115879866 [Sitophilus oryzae]
MPVFLTEGITHLLPKTENPDNPSQYRPITCLPSIYKIFSSCISSTIYTYLVTNNILHEEQKGCKSRAMGSKEQLVIDSVVLEQARHNKRNIFMGYIDYQKAFDSIPHSWLLQVLEIYNVDPKICRFFKTMPSWTTSLNLRSAPSYHNIAKNSNS